MKKRMKLGLCMFLVCFIVKAFTQNYYINFTANSGILYLDSILVENLSSGASLHLNGLDTLHLVGTTNIKDIYIENNEIFVYPNPLETYTTLSLFLDQTKTVRFSVWDITGKRILQTDFLLELGLQSLQLFGLSNGIYFLNVQGPNLNVTKKIISMNSSQIPPKIEKSNSSAYYEHIVNRSGFLQAKNTVIMSYTNGDSLAFTGFYAGDSNVIFDVPSSSKTIDFVFATNVLPKVTTLPIINSTHISAQGGGNVTDDGGNVVTARGVCWSQLQNPDLTDSHSIDGVGIGNFTSNITGLSPNTTYYVRAYATNSIGTAYGNEESFTTSANIVLPTITTTIASNIMQTTASSGGNITDDGGANVTARGVCWSTSQNPTLADPHTTDGTGIGNFTSNITGLTPNTTYFVRAYATNSVGTAYGNQENFTTINNLFVCGDTIIDIRDGNAYSTVLIGNQCWMAKNLKYLPSVVGATSSSTIPYYFVYGYQGTNVVDAKATYNYATYGVLYNWRAVMAGSASSSTNPSGVQGVCPTGWHVPSDAEWTQLTTFLGGITIAGGELKEMGTINWEHPNSGATNQSGFTALPGGYMQGSPTYPFDLIKYNGYWWTSTNYGGATPNPFYRGLDRWSTEVEEGYVSGSLGKAVRCVKD